MSDDRTTDERAGDRPKRAAEDCRHPVLGYLGRNAGVHCVDCGTIWKRTRVPGGINGQGRLVALRVPVPPAVEGAAAQADLRHQVNPVVREKLAVLVAAVTPGAHVFVACPPTCRPVEQGYLPDGHELECHAPGCGQVESAAVHS